MLGHVELSTTQIYTQVAIRKLQQVHAMTHPGAKRRLRGQQMALDVGEPQPDPHNAASAFLEALAREADEEIDEEREGDARGPRSFVALPFIRAQRLTRNLELVPGTSSLEWTCRREGAQDITAVAFTREGAKPCRPPSEPCERLAATRATGRYVEMAKGHSPRSACQGRGRLDAGCPRSIRSGLRARSSSRQ
ncbi:hypothetical protein [Variovorax sp. LjRoot290]|uniref:hypothetical protein n=1 Tax=Variovorax sp. LjRoot290 TaxID=3342316 RepID=UPI003F50DC71